MSEVTGPKAERRADRALLATYHEARLADLLERVRERFAAYDAGNMDAFQLDDLIHHYKQAARELWKFCSDTGAKGQQAVRTVEYLKQEGREPDWWELGAGHSRRP